jgi:hypothetical protein
VPLLQIGAVVISPESVEVAVVTESAAINVMFQEQFFFVVSAPRLAWFFASAH